MKRNLPGRLLPLLAVVAILASPLAHAGAIVVGRSSPINEITPEEARRVFLGRQPSLDGQELTVVFQQPSAIRTEFETRVIGKTGAELNIYMARLIFTGESKPPVETFGDQAVKSKVNGNPGAIGYISDAAIDASVKVLMRY
jgi:ABC-type phosphate transport system substrate-binding protein